ncbi:MAG: hypothetical protein HUJ73_08915 [Eubacterium sp.]|nr:hypothetical protein [Eubacterium sp.]
MMEKLWVKQYMRETKPKQRKAILEQAIADEGMMPDNELRQKIAEKRYTVVDHNDADLFLRGWLTLHFMENLKNTAFNRKRIQREKGKILSDWQFPTAKEYGEIGDQVLYEELFNMTKLYIELCTEDKHYKSIILGLGTMSKEKLRYKIAKDVYNVAFAIPKRLAFADEVGALADAARDAYCEVFDEEKEFLLELIREGEKEK